MTVVAGLDITGGVDVVGTMVPVVLPGARMSRPTTSDSVPSPARDLNIHGTSSRFMLGGGREAMAAGILGGTAFVETFGIFTDVDVVAECGCNNDDVDGNKFIDDDEVGSDETLVIVELICAKFVNLANWG